MTQIHIESNGHTVTVDHDGADLAYAIEKTQKLWEDTKPPTRTESAIGFMAERTHGRNGFAWNMSQGEQPAVTA